MKRHWPLILALDLFILCLIILFPPLMGGEGHAFLFGHRRPWIAEGLDTYALSAYIIFWLCASAALWAVILSPHTTPHQIPIDKKP